MVSIQSRDSLKLDYGDHHLRFAVTSPFIDAVLQPTSSLGYSRRGTFGERGG